MRDRDAHAAHARPSGPMDGRRAILLVLDSVGVGPLPDARRYGDEGSNTLVNTALAVGGLSLPNMANLGLGHLADIKGVPPVSAPLGSFGVLQEVSPGKDTTTGHWEIAGIILERPFPTYPHGFPPEVIEPFKKAIGRDILANFPASGTEIIAQLGNEHMRTGKPIVYTSADSVFQIACHEEIIPVEELYRECEIARRLLTGEHAVGRVIARPFAGKPGEFYRTERRHDFSLPPPRPTLLNHVADAGMGVFAVGKIKDIFAGCGITRAVHTKNNMEGIDWTVRLMDEVERGLIFTNCVDFDMLYGHRNDAPGYAKALEAVDRRLPEILGRLRPGDVLIITADHGCDPTTPSTDHSREQVPLLVAGPDLASGRKLGVRRSFADVGRTVAEWLGVRPLEAGESFLALLRDER